MTKEEFRRAYPADNWVLNTQNLHPGDILKGYADDLQQEMDVEVADIFDNYTFLGIVEYKGSTQFVEMSISNDIFFLVDSFCSPPELPSECSCGAKYTSNPNFHLSYCKRG